VCFKSGTDKKGVFMRTIKLSVLIAKSVERTKLILFRPFSLKKWLCLLLIASLSGALGIAGNGGGGGSRRCEKKAEAAQVQASQTINPEKQILDSYGQMYTESTEQDPGICFFRNGFSNIFPGMLLIGTGLALAALFVTLFFVFIWLGARFRFVWFESMIKNDASIKDPFHEYKKEGNSLFKFFLILIPAVIFLFAGLGIWFYLQGLAAGIFSAGAEPGPGLFLSVFIGPILTGLFFLLLLAVFSVCVDHFVVTIMAMDRCGFIEGWKKFFLILKNNLKDISLFFLSLFGLGIVTNIIQLIIVLALILAVILSGGAFFGLLYLLLAVALKAKTVFAVVAIVLAIPALFCFVLLMISVGLPFAVFFRNLTLYYLTSLKYGYAPLALEENGIVEEMGEA